MNNRHAIRIGSLANKPQFFGGNLTEVNLNDAARGSWNGDYAYSVHSDESWFLFGGYSLDGEAAGLFSSLPRAGIMSGELSHRAILSGY